MFILVTLWWLQMDDNHMERRAFVYGPYETRAQCEEAKRETDEGEYPGRFEYIRSRCVYAADDE